MTSPSFLNTDFQKSALVGVTDFSTFLTAVVTLLTSTLSSTASGNFPSTQRWTNTSGNTYQSPADAKGRYMTIAFTRNSATSLGIQISDPTGLLLNGQVQLNSGGSAINIMAGPGHFYMEVNNNGTWETARAFISDPTPETLDTATSYVWCFTHRDNTGSVESNNDSDHWFGRFADGSVTSAGSPTQCTGRPYMLVQDTTSTRLLTEAGSDVTASAGIGIATNASSLTTSSFSAGKCYQLIMVDANMSAGNIMGAVPVDTGITGRFQVLQVAATGCCRLAVRIP